MLTRLQISSEELSKLNYERYHYPCPIVQKRLHSVYIKATSGLSNEQVGNFTDAHRNSISEWVNLYQQGGIDELLKVNYGTNKSVLESHATHIAESFTQAPPRSIGEAMIKIEALTGIHRSHSRVRAFMKRHGFRFLKTGHLPAKVNNTAQHQWMEETLQPVIKAAQDGQVHLLFMGRCPFCTTALPLLFVVCGKGIYKSIRRT